MIANFFAVSGFIANSEIPSSAAFSLLNVSVNPLQRIIGISGRISFNFLDKVSPLIFGIVISVITRSNRSGFDLNNANASRGFVLIST